MGNVNYDYIVTVGGDTSGLSKEIQDAISEADENVKIKIKCDDSQVKSIIRGLSNLKPEIAANIIVNDKSLNQINKEYKNAAQNIQRQLNSVNIDNLNSKLSNAQSKLQELQNKPVSDIKTKIKQLNSELDKSSNLSVATIKQKSQELLNYLSLYKTITGSLSGLTDDIGPSLKENLNKAKTEYGLRPKKIEYDNKSVNTEIVNTKNLIQQLEGQIAQYHNLVKEFEDLKQFLDIEKIVPDKFKLEIDTSGLNPDQIEAVNAAIERLNSNIKDPQGKTKYFTSMEDAGKRVADVFKTLTENTDITVVPIDQLSSDKNATAVLRYANAFEALGGNLDELDPKISEFVNSMRQIDKFTSGKGYNFTVDEFKKAFAEFEVLRDVGIGIGGFGNGTGTGNGTGNGSGAGASSEEIKQLISLLESLNAEIIKIRGAFGTIDDESGVTSLLSQLKEINTQISSTTSEVIGLSEKISELSKIKQSENSISDSINSDVQYTNDVIGSENAKANAYEHTAETAENASKRIIEANKQEAQSNVDQKSLVSEEYPINGYINETITTNENDNLLSIQENIQKITQAVQLKNEAFQLERQIVENAANSEVESLRQLSDILDNITLSVKQCSEVFDKLGSSPIDLNLFSDDDLERIKNLSSDLSGLSSLNGFFEKLNTNVPEDLPSKINSLADAIEKLKNKFEGFPESGTTVFSQLNSLASQKDTLKDLAEVLNASSKKIDEAKDKISKKSKYDVAREYLSKNESSILDQTRSYFEGQGKELLSSEMSAAKNGLVEIKTLVKDIGDDGSVSYHNYVLTISEDTDLLVKSVSEGTVAAEKAGRAFERIFNTETGSDVLGGFSITEGTDDWKEITDVLQKFGIQAENVSKIIRNIRRDSDGNFLESFNVTTKDGSTRTIGRSSQSIISGKDEIFNIDDIENKYNNLFKKLRTAKLNLAKNNNDEFAIVDVAKAESEISELEKLIENLKGKMLSEDDYKNIIDQGAKYRNSITKDVYAALEKKNKPKATPKSSNKPKVDVNKQRENEVDNYIRDLERLKKAEQNFAKNGGDQNKAIIESLTNSLSESKNKISKYLDNLSDEYKNKFSKVGEGIISDIAKINPNNQLVSDDQKDRAKVLTDNEKVAESYDKLANKAERYYNLKNKKETGNITDKESAELAGLEKQINLANEAMSGSSTAANEYKANLNGVQSELENVTSAQERYTDAMNEAQKKTRENYADGKNDSLDKIIEGLYSEANRPTAYAEQLEKIKSKFEEIKDITSNGVVSDEAFGDYAKKIKEIEKMISDIRKGGEYSYARSEDINALDAKITKWSNTNTVAAKKYKAEISSLTDRLHEAGLTSAELDKIKVAFDEISASAVKAGITGQSFGDRVKNKFKELASYLMSFASFYDIINIGRQAIDIITELDDALTEMRKVSEEPLSVLKSYQKETFNTAADIGTTSAQLQQSTADFMRLGESLNDAKESAADATILMNVSEFDSIDSATDSLIAMSQAYDELGKMDVIDKLNNVGKLLAQTYSNIWRFYLS